MMNRKKFRNIKNKRFKDFVFIFEEMKLIRYPKEETIHRLPMKHSPNLFLKN